MQGSGEGQAVEVAIMPAFQCRDCSLYTKVQYVPKRKKLCCKHCGSSNLSAPVKLSQAVNVLYDLIGSLQGAQA
jgi:Zn finger protein HypA/HybF involved in hydrogenase expression